MWLYERFKGDNTSCYLYQMQDEMYDYSSSRIFTTVKRVYLENEVAVLYFEKEHLMRLREIVSYDHRMIQLAHDAYAAVFRYNHLNGEYCKELFDPTVSELSEYFSRKFIDTDFLSSVPEQYWYLAKHWLVFLERMIHTHLDVTKQIAQAVILNNNPDTTSDWESCNKAELLIYLEYQHIPWLNFDPNAID